MVYVRLNKQWNPEWQKYCSMYFGQQFDDWRCYRDKHEVYPSYVFKFKNKNHALQFKLRWLCS